MAVRRGAGGKFVSTKKKAAPKPRAKRTTRAKRPVEPKTRKVTVITVDAVTGYVLRGPWRKPANARLMKSDVVARGKKAATNLRKRKRVVKLTVGS